MSIREDAEDLGVSSGLPPEEDLGSIEVRTQIWRVIDVFPVGDKYLTSSRPRTVEDEDKAFDFIKTPPPRKPVETVEWPKWGESGLVDPKIANRLGSGGLPNNMGFIMRGRNAAYDAAQEKN